jgi:hypothetical protein
MYVLFGELSPESRVWVYTGSRAFTAAEEVFVSKALKDFCAEWAAHGQALKSSFKIESHQFIIMAVDEDFHSPSGCSIDSSVGVMRQIHQATGVDLLDRSKVPFYIQNEVKLIPVPGLKQQFQQGQLHPESVTFNTLVATKAEFDACWQMAAEKTWMSKYLTKTALTS